MAVTHNQIFALFGGMFAAVGGMTAALAALWKRKQS